MTNNNWIELRKKYIHKFCNDHNGKVRWLRGIFMDDEDAIEEHLTFISNLLTKKDQEHKAELEMIKGEIESKTVRPILGGILGPQDYQRGFTMGYEKGQQDALQDALSIIDKHIK